MITVPFSKKSSALLWYLLFSPGEKPFDSYWGGPGRRRRGARAVKKEPLVLFFKKNGTLTFHLAGVKCDGSPSIRAKQYQKRFEANQDPKDGQRSLAAQAPWAFSHFSVYCVQFVSNPDISTHATHPKPNPIFDEDRLCRILKTASFWHRRFPTKTKSQLQNRQNKTTKKLSERWLWKLLWAN